MKQIFKYFLLSFFVFEGYVSASRSFIEENIPYSTVLLRTHYTEEIERIDLKEKNAITQDEKETLKKSISIVGTGFFYVDLPLEGAEEKYFKDSLESLFDSKEKKDQLQELTEKLAIFFSSKKKYDKINESIKIYFSSGNREYEDTIIGNIFDSNNEYKSLFNDLKKVLSDTDKENFTNLILINAIFESKCQNFYLERHYIGSSCFSGLFSYFLKDLSRLFVVTNRHVLFGKDKKNLSLSKDVFFDFKTRIDNSKRYRLSCEQGKNLFFHPNCDVCMIDVSKILEDIPDLNYTAFNRNHIIDAEEDLPPVTSTVYMTGYPKSLYDKVNNLPVTRSGSVASPMDKDWNGKPEFLTDITVFKGSSGSPIFYLHKPITLYFNTETAVTLVEFEDFTTEDDNSFVKDLKIEDYDNFCDRP